MSVLANFYEDIEIGAHYEFGSQVFDAEHIKKFATNYDPQSFHMDEEAAKSSHFGALCASGWQTASTALPATVLELATRATPARPKSMNAQPLPV